jgi:uncharacterized membrane protein
MVNPFDLRTVLLAKHAQHVVLVHFPIALFMSGVAFDLLSRGNRASQLGGAAYLNLSVAAVSVLPVLATGLLAWQFVLEGQRLKGLLLWHLMAAWLTALVIVATWWVHWRTRKSGVSLLPSYRIPVELFGVALIAVTAHLGGFLSGINP